MRAYQPRISTIQRMNRIAQALHLTGWHLFSRGRVVAFNADGMRITSTLDKLDRAAQDLRK